MTADPRTWVSDSRKTVPYGTKAEPGDYIVYPAPSTKGLSMAEVRIEHMPYSSDVWVFPIKPSAKVCVMSEEARNAFDSGNYANELALGSKSNLIQSLDESTRKILNASAPENAGAAGALAELFRHGTFDYRTMPDAKLRTWLDSLYLGTWQDTSWAASAFLKDLDASISDDRRQEAYERLKEMLVIIELPLGNGRTAVCLEQPCEYGERFIVVQWMLHRNIPTVMSV